jgi:large subunit ribosomal protein L15
MITLQDLSPSNARHKPKRVGRGNSSGKGTTAGRGTKGQRARTGGRNKLTRRSLKRLFERTPKTRGFQSRTPKLMVVSLDQLEKAFKEGANITPKAMQAAGLITRTWPGVKVLGQTKMKKKFTVQADAFSKQAAEQIQKIGGTIKTRGPQPAPESKA